MTIGVSNQIHELFPEFHFEEEDRLRAQLLPKETQLWLKSRSQELVKEIIGTQLQGTPEEISKSINQVNFLKGKVDAFMELLEAAHNAEYVTQKST